jgi:hypothetical protein
MRTAKTKLAVRWIEVEGSADTIKGVLESFGNLFPQNVAETKTRKIKKQEPQTPDLLPQ